MKNCDEMVNSLLRRREQYAAAQKRKRTVIIRTTASICCVCLVTLLSLGMRHGSIFSTTPLNDSINAGSKKDMNPDAPNSDTGTTSETEMPCITSFDMRDRPSSSYATPANGEVSFSTPLREAMHEYEDRVKYRVVIDVFSDHDQLSSDSSQVQEERERLSGIGYTVAYETFFDGESSRHYLTLHAAYDELTEFAANESYGYFMFLYDERVEPAAGSPKASNGGTQQ